MSKVLQLNSQKRWRWFYGITQELVDFEQNASIVIPLVLLIAIAAIKMLVEQAHSMLWVTSEKKIRIKFWYDVWRGGGHTDSDLSG